jgi:hypothetical protein
MIRIRSEELFAKRVDGKFGYIRLPHLGRRRSRIRLDLGNDDPAESEEKREGDEDTAAQVNESAKSFHTFDLLAEIRWLLRGR